MRQRKTKASGLKPTVSAATAAASQNRRSCKSLSVASIATKPSVYAYSPVNSGAAASTPNTREGQSAALPHSRSAIEEKSIVDPTAATKTSGRFPTSAAGR
jgi:hypothetical protein